MALERINIQIAIPKVIYDSIPEAKKIAARNAIRELKALSVNINEGQPNEELTTITKRQTCYHDETPPKPCEPWQEI